MLLQLATVHRLAAAPLRQARPSARAVVGRGRQAPPATAHQSSTMPQGESGVDHEAYHARWESQWTRDGGLKPGQAFDAARESPALAHALATGALDVRGKRVYVPGCGRGYDLPAFLRAGAAEVVGLEYAPTAQQEAAAFVASQLAPEEALRAPVHCGDFFRWACPSGLDFDVGYDYTFFCALHPDMRRDWAAAWARALRPGAELVCLAFPIGGKDGVETGPPWPVQPQQYKDLLLPQGFELLGEQPVPPELSHAGRGGKEALLRFRRM